MVTEFVNNTAEAPLEILPGGSECNELHTRGIEMPNNYSTQNLNFQLFYDIFPNFQGDKLFPHTVKNMFSGLNYKTLTFKFQ